MTEEFDFNKIIESSDIGRYEKRISVLEDKGLYVENIKEVIDKSIKNLRENKNSFIIYGEPQSGKTELMIALTNKLLDEGYKTIIILVTDQITLLNQNLKRFKDSKLNPSPKNYTEVLNQSGEIGDRPLVVFCKKNSQNLKKLIGKLGDKKGRIIIDDEADYATPNSNVNREEMSKIHEHTKNLINEGGVYIGVTATPARLDLNNTHKNDVSAWIIFKPHPNYTGQDHFFPLDRSSIKYKLNLMPEGYDNSYLKKAVLNFLINSAHLNLKSSEEGYSMLIHTSRKKIDHSEDKKQVLEIINILASKKEGISQNLYKEIWEIAKMKYPGEEYEITKYITKNIDRYDIRVLNSNRDKSLDDSTITKPISPFTIIIGGEIVSRGVTFDRLLSMFFTRDVIKTFYQDTYIQRARMFGSRKDYLKYFELYVPQELYLNWNRSFALHRLSIESLKNNPAWAYDSKIKPTGRSSIDSSTVINSGTGEMGFEMFEYDEDFANEILFSHKTNLEKLRELSTKLGEGCLPSFLINYIEKNSPDRNESLAIRSSTDISKWTSSDTDKENIKRVRGFIDFPQSIKEQFPKSLHHLKIIFNSENKKARIYYVSQDIKTGFMINIKSQGNNN